jgi:hypothetical protein
MELTCASGPRRTPRTTRTRLRIRSLPVAAAEALALVDRPATAELLLNYTRRSPKVPGL